LTRYLYALSPLPKIAAKAISKAKGRQCTIFPFPNVLFGASIEDQIRANERMPIMSQLKQKGWHTFISAEPLLEEVNLHLDQYPVDWVIIGGESGHKARPFNLNWGRSLLKQCQDNNVKVFFKQMGANVVDSSPYIVGTVAESTNWKVNFKDKKGGDPEEWEEIFQVREMPDILVLQKDVTERSHPNS
jgi:protein gp37